MTETQRVLISGSVAYDTIMVFDGHFKDHILPDRTHMLNVSFLTPRLKREFGGCAANIAYNLQGLGGEPVIMATIGCDGNDYLARLAALGLDLGSVRQLDDHFTAQAFITTDLSDNQITAFHPGAMTEAHQVRVEQSLPARYGIVGPNGKQAMLEHAADFASAGVPFLFDPGQGLPMFDGDELRSLIALADSLAVNDYEAAMLCERTGLSEQQIASELDALIVTRGDQGSVIHVGGLSTTIAAVPISEAIDPSGCGDAYRAGLLYGRVLGWDWQRCAQLGSVMGAIKIEHQGPQNHQVDREQIAERHQASYGTRPW